MVLLLLVLTAGVALTACAAPTNACRVEYDAPTAQCAYVWQGQRHVSNMTAAAGQDDCVQRLWCTDSGAAVMFDRAARTIHYTWIASGRQGEMAADFERCHAESNVVVCTRGVSELRIDFSEERNSCVEGYYDDPQRGCTECPVGHFCTRDKIHKCPANSFTREPGHDCCAVPPGYYWRYQPAYEYAWVQLCRHDHYCPGGYAGEYKCPPMTRSPSGSSSIAQCL